MTLHTSLYLKYINLSTNLFILLTARMFVCFLLPGMKTTVSEAEHPLLCEGTRREKGDLALALMITYKDDQSKLKKVCNVLVVLIIVVLTLFRWY